MLENLSRKKQPSHLPPPPAQPETRHTDEAIFHSLGVRSEVTKGAGQIHIKFHQQPASIQTNKQVTGSSTSLRALVPLGAIHGRNNHSPSKQAGTLRHGESPF